MRRRIPLLVALAGLALAAGCIGSDSNPAEPAPSPTGADNGTAPGLAPSFAPPSNVSQTWGGAEPVVDVASDGTVFVQGLSGALTGTHVWRSTDGGDSWEEVTPPVLGEHAPADAFLAVAPDDSVYVANAFSGKLVVFKSTDMGDTWVPVGQPPVDPPMHRMWLVPRDEGTVHLLYEKLWFGPVDPPNVYYVRSEDAGRTWTAPVEVDDATHYGSDLAVGPEGTLYNVRLDDGFGASNASRPADLDHRDASSCAKQSGWYVRVSTDDGQTWDKRRMFGSGGENCQRLSSGWQSLEVDRDGTVYFLWGWEKPEGTSRIHLSVSHDRGRTWSSPQPLFPDRGAQVLPWFDVRGPGELGVVWYAADEQGSSESMDAEWYVDYALVTNATADEPTSHVTRVTPYPVHQGNICTEGPACDRGEDRSLADYTWTVFGPEGRARLAFASTEITSENPAPVRIDAFPVYATETTPTQP